MTELQGRRAGETRQQPPRLGEPLSHRRKGATRKRLNQGRKQVEESKRMQQWVGRERERGNTQTLDHPPPPTKEAVMPMFHFPSNGRGTQNSQLVRANSASHHGIEIRTSLQPCACTLSCFYPCTSTPVPHFLHRIIELEEPPRSSGLTPSSERLITKAFLTGGHPTSYQSKT